MLSDDWEKVVKAADRLGEIGGEDVFQFLISMLDSDDSGVRNRAALALAEIKDDRALEPLFNAIFKNGNRNYNGTLVFALESLNCKDWLVKLFDILFYESYEAKISAAAILDDQEFEFSKADLLSIKEKYEDLKRHPEKFTYKFDEEAKDWVEEFVNAYLSYLSQNRMERN